MDPVHTEIELKDLVLNTRQIEGLPALCGSGLRAVAAAGLCHRVRGQALQ